MLKNNKPLFVINNIEDYMQITDDEKLEIAAKRILKKYHNAFVDGNKRIGILMMLSFLESNGM